MKLISFDYYYERILLRYQKAEQDKTSKNLTIQSVIKIMVRSLQMYETIEQIILIFTLLTKLEKAQDQRMSPVKYSPTKSPIKAQKEDELERAEKLKAKRQQERMLSMRLRIVIKQLVTYNKFMQKRFIFKGVEMMGVLGEKIRELNR